MLRTVRSNPNLRRAVHSSAVAPKPSVLQQRSLGQYESLSVAGLRSACKSRGLKVGGKKADLINRLSAADVTSSAGFHGSSIASQLKRPDLSVSAQDVSQTLVKNTRSMKTKSNSGNLRKQKSSPVIELTKKQPLSSSARLEAKNDSSTIDYFSMPQPKPSVTKDLPDRIIPIEIDTSVASHAPADSTSTKTAVREVHHVAGETGKVTASPARTTTPTAESEESSETVKFSPASEEEFGSRDRTLLGAIAGVAAAWWLLPDLFSKKKKSKN
ncbi:hypothetical protein CANCADRAFT_42766 [Tortispora caseinolytica NRRL Y-17796]|uniref:SAP domain-containing protein n=1 Tax=Tortispora caseinolytica NRRL Y-17796 TaxID=767744 RepID=A0A1E4TK92_9ASCO|nr:hypothetical protein CANCADRAFT_42766 [Tortispora caseinolytica NRRL Y-17796]